MTTPAEYKKFIETRISWRDAFCGAFSATLGTLEQLEEELEGKAKEKATLKRIALKQLFSDFQTKAELP